MPLPGACVVSVNKKGALLRTPRPSVAIGMFSQPTHSLTSEFLEAKVCHLQHPSGVDEAITRAEIAVVEDVTLVQVQHGLSETANKHLVNRSPVTTHHMHINNSRAPTYLMSKMLILLPLAPITTVCKNNSTFARHQPQGEDKFNHV